MFNCLAFKLGRIKLLLQILRKFRNEKKSDYMAKKRNFVTPPPRFSLLFWQKKHKIKKMQKKVENLY